MWTYEAETITVGLVRALPNSHDCFTAVNETDVTVVDGNAESQNNFNEALNNYDFTVWKSLVANKVT